MNIFIINGAQKFAHSSGAFNETLNNWTVAFLRKKGSNFVQPILMMSLILLLKLRILNGQM